MKKLQLLITLCLLFCAAPAWAIDLSGLSQPESVILDEKTGEYYISNINGEPLDKDANGFITKVDRAGLVIVLKAIESNEAHPLHAPKGLGIFEGKLYVTDIDVVQVYDLLTNAHIAEISFEGLEPKFLNDLVIDGKGVIYVSDMQTNRIFRIDQGEVYTVSTYQSGEMLAEPNGLLIEGHTGNLIIATWAGRKLLELAGNELRVLRDNLEEGLDGLALDRKGNLYVSSWTKGEIYKITERGKGKLTLFQSGLVNPSDISYDQLMQTLLVPLMRDGQLTSFEVD